MTTGWPDEYYAVIFTTQRTDAEMAMYGLTSERMIELAQQQPGFLGLEAVREDPENQIHLRCTASCLLTLSRRCR